MDAEDSTVHFQKSTSLRAVGQISNGCPHLPAWAQLYLSNVATRTWSNMHSKRSIDYKINVSVIFFVVVVVGLHIVKAHGRARTQNGSGCNITKGTAGGEWGCPNSRAEGENTWRWTNK